MIDREGKLVERKKREAVGREIEEDVEVPL